MMMSAHRLRSVGWFALLALCGALVMVLAFRVNALRSQVHRSEELIVALKQETAYLETEFETRANQQQLKAWNDVDFGYVAPGAGQYLENERQLAALSKPAAPDAPAPIRVASIDDNVAAAAAFPTLVSPITGKRLADAEADRSGGAPRITRLDHKVAAPTLGERLGTLDGNLGKASPASQSIAARSASAKSAATKVKLGAKTEKTVEKQGAKSSRLASAELKAMPGKKEVKAER